MKKPRILKGRRMWIWFITLSMAASFLVMLFSGSLQVKRKISTDAPLEEFKRYINERIPHLMKQYGIPGCSIALVKDFKLTWTESYGYADVENRRVLTVDTPMSVQSITKPVTAWGVIKLVEKGLVDLDAPVSQYLTSWKFPKSDYPVKKITVRQLLSHTSGMPLGDFTKIYSLDEVMPSNRDVMTEEAILVRKPGAGFSYSNIGYNLLEILIEDVTGQSFSEYIRNEVLLPLGMNSSFFNIDTLEPYPPTGYNLEGKMVPVYLYPSKASGGLFATAHDIALFAAAGMQGNLVLSEDSIKQLYTPQSNKIGIYGFVFDAYGFGHYIEKLPNGMLSVSHGGQGNGIMTHLQSVPETGDAIVILTNSQRSWPLIAYVLSDWAQWRGFSSVGMERIIWGHYGLCVIVGILVASSIMVILRMIVPFNQKMKTFAIMLKLAMSFVFLGILIWCSCQKYLFVSSVFPILSVWLGWAVLVFSIVLLLSVVLPICL
ncbi:MAG: serine hydrolase domain-containing protein [Clostridia bacterium]|jgi:CubicO group peptidase (beta-lactamase class C family)|nr:beta-lactamase family protein [Clostridiaceae bacterium]